MNTIVCMGDSLTYGKEWPSGGDLQQTLNTMIAIKYPGVRVVNLGLNGDSSSGLWSRRTSANTYNPFRVLVWIGINDVTGSVAAATIETNLQNIYTYYKGLGYEVWAFTISPHDDDNSTKNAIRVAVNLWIKNTAINVDRVIDAFAAVADPQDTTKRLPEYAVPGSPNHINDAGINAIVSLFP